MKATKEHIGSLTDILYRLKAAEIFIENDNILICRKGDNTAFAYKNKDGESIGTLTKFVGSSLNQLKNAINELENLIETSK
jgi:hypothetical protein